MKKLVEYILKILAQRIVRRFNPKIIGITGSIGKTTTRACISHVLKSEYRVLETIKNYNSEIGVPLSILEQETGKNILDWIKVLYKSFLKSFFCKEYYDVLVLEMGADKSGDIEYLTDIVSPDISVVTNVEHVHIENYGNSRDAIAKEKSMIINKTKKDGICFVNYDNTYTHEMVKIRDNVFTFGFDKNADFFAKDILSTIDGVSGTLISKNNKVDINCPLLFGKHSMYGILIAYAIGIKMNIPIDSIKKSIKTFNPPKNRLSIIDGINKSKIIDSTYNAEPESMKAAINVLEEIGKDKNKIAFLGDMFELGSFKKEAHEEMGKFLLEKNIDIVYFVGEAMKFAYNKYCGKKALHFNKTEDILRELPLLNETNLVLVKGSRGMRMEKIIEKLRNP